MSEQFLAEMEQNLVAMRDDLLERLSSGDEDFRVLANAMGIKDSVDVAQDDIAFKKMEAISRHDANRLRSVDAALTRLRNGRYGICMKCGSKIPEERLRAIPYAMLCIDCKSNEENPVKKNW